MVAQKTGNELFVLTLSAHGVAIILAALVDMRDGGMLRPKEKEAVGEMIEYLRQSLAEGMPVRKETLDA